MPAAAVDATVIDIDEVPAPVMDVGLKPTVTPEGWPDAESVTAESNPPVTELVMVEEPDPPCAIETEPGEADRLKPGWVVVVPASALISPVPLGLPQPVTRSYPVVAAKLPEVPVRMSWKSGAYAEVTFCA